ELAAEHRERLHGAAVAGLDGSDLAVRLRRLRLVAEPVGREVGVREAKPRRFARIVAERLDRFEVRDAERGEIARRLRERLQLVFDQLVAWRERERAREVRERAGRVAL